MKNLEHRLQRLERRSGGTLQWPAPHRHVARIATWIATGRAPTDAPQRELLAAGAHAILQGLAPDEHLTPRTCTIADLLRLYVRGGACEYVYLDMAGSPARPEPIPRAWRSVARDLAALERDLPRAFRVDDPGLDWSYA